MYPVCLCAVVQLPEYICVHSLVLSFHVLGSSLSVFELCLSLSIWATEFLLSACKVLLCAWSMRFLRPFATSMSFWVCILGPWASFSHFPLSVCYVPVVRLCATSVLIRGGNRLHSQLPSECDYLQSTRVYGDNRTRSAVDCATSVTYMFFLGKFVNANCAPRLSWTSAQMRTPTPGFRLMCLSSRSSGFQTRKFSI